MLRKIAYPVVILTGALLALMTIHPTTPARPIATPTTSATSTHTLPACTHETGEGQMLCTWDADTQGNGKGTDVVAGDCSTGTVGTHEASVWCVKVWVQDAHTQSLGNGASSDTPNGSVLVSECMDIEHEARADKATRIELDNEGWTLTECFKAMIR